VISATNLIIYDRMIGSTTSIGLLWGGLSTTIFLIILLSLKEIISASSYYDETAESSFSVLIIPQLITFFAIVIFKTIEVLYP